MGVIVDENKMAMVLMNIISDRFDGIFRKIVALSNGDRDFTFRFVKIRCEQEDKFNFMRVKAALFKSELVSIVESRSYYQNTWVHYGSIKSSSFYKKFTNFSPPGCFRKLKTKPSLVRLLQIMQQKMIDLSVFPKQVYQEYIELGVNLESLAPDSGEGVIDSCCIKTSLTMVPPSKNTLWLTQHHFN